MSLNRRAFLQRTTAATAALIVTPPKGGKQINTPIVEEKNEVWLSLVPMDSRCRLFSNLLWTKDDRGNSTLSKQHLWVGFPQALAIQGAIFKVFDDIESLRFETSFDNGKNWNILASTSALKTKKDDLPLVEEWPNEPKDEAALDTHSVRWQSIKTDNIRVVVEKPLNPCFPIGEYFAKLNILCKADTQHLEFERIDAKYIPLTEGEICIWQPAEGDPGQSIWDRMGYAHRRMETNRVSVSDENGTVIMKSPNMHMKFSRHFALIRSLGWDMGGNGREDINLISSDNTQGAFPVVGRGIERHTSGSGGGQLYVKGRQVTYRDVSVVPELKQNLSFSVREDGFQLQVEWDCVKTFRTHEIAGLRIPFDLYRTVTNVLAVPNTTGPSGLVNLPLVIHAPNHGTMQVTVKDNNAGLPVQGRISPFRVRAELWLDLIVGAVPLKDGLFEVPAGKGSITLDFKLTKIFPFSETDIFNWWNRPPCYSFVDRENILGALPNAWLSGFCFRPELAMYANNSVSEAAAPCAPFYADIAAYTPELAPGLAAADIMKYAADSLLTDNSKSDFNNASAFPMAANSPLDCAWLTVASSGDWDWAHSRKPYIVEKAQALLNMEYQKTGLAASIFSGRPTDPGFMTASWTDSIRSGHLESFMNATIYRSTVRTAELAARLGEMSLSRELKSMSARAKKHFTDIFYDPRRRRIAQWVDVDGKRYDFDSRLHLGSSITCGLIENGLARKLLLEYLERLKKSGFSSYQYGLPIFLDPVPAVCHNNWKGKGIEKDGSDLIGIYQNGSITHHHCYWLLQALYQTGLRKQANDLFMKISPLARKGGISGGLHSGVDWRMKDGSPSGYEGLLAEGFQFLLSAITGYLGWELTIDGLRLNPEVKAICSDRVQKVKPNFARIAG